LEDVGFVLLFPVLFIFYLFKPYTLIICPCSPLGKLRRFSDHFLVTEKENLNDYCEAVRKYYAQLSAGLLDSLPSDIALPFSLGQPRSRELCDGKVLMVKP
jgi:hypothetical protein